MNKTLDELIKERHSVRKYKDKSIEENKLKELNSFVEEVNKESNLNIQLVNDGEVFNLFVIHYGNCNAKYYFAMIGKKGDNLEEKIGYYGEKIVLKAQDLGLNTCWMTGTFSRKNVKAEVIKDEKIVGVIALGYGENSGTSRKSKTFNEVSITKDAPDWYEKGVEYALLAPTALNEQKFKFELISDNTVKAYPGKGLGQVKLDLGIAKYHFEVGAGKKIKWI